MSKKRVREAGVSEVQGTAGEEKEKRGRKLYAKVYDSPNSQNKEGICSECVTLHS